MGAGFETSSGRDKGLPGCFEKEEREGGRRRKRSNDTSGLCSPPLQPFFLYPVFYNGPWAFVQNTHKNPPLLKSTLLTCVRRGEV